MPNQDLSLALQKCSLHPLLMIVSKALTRAGYGDVQFLDRRHSRQKSRLGGHELVCEVTLGTRSVRVAVKVISDAVRLRMVDEMWGTVHRTKSDMGLIVSPFHLTKGAREALPSYAPEVQVLDGLALAELLTTYNIGLREGRVDWDYFLGLEEVSDRLLAFIEMERR